MLFFLNKSFIDFLNILDNIEKTLTTRKCIKKNPGLLNRIFNIFCIFLLPLDLVYGIAGISITQSKIWGYCLKILSYNIEDLMLEL